MGVDGMAWGVWISSQVVNIADFLIAEIAFSRPTKVMVTLP